MSATNLQPPGRFVVLSIWAGGLAVAAGATAWSLTHRSPAQGAFEVFLSMAAVLLISDMLPAHGNRGWVGRWPLVGLTATVIVFSHDPLIAVLAIAVAAPLAGLLDGLSLLGQLTKTARWLIACGLGLLGFGAVVNVGHLGSALGAGVLIVGYAVGENYATIALGFRRGAGSRPIHQLDEFSASLVYGGMGAAYALSWRSSEFGHGALQAGKLAVIASVGIVAGYLLGGTIKNLSRGADRIRGRTVFLVVLVGVGILVLPSGLALAVAIAVTAILILSLRARTLGGIICCVGALANLAMVQLNGGMPIDASSFFRLVGPAGYARYASQTYLDTSNTKLPLLDDRIVLPHPFPFAEVLSIGDLFVMIGLVVLIVERMLRHPRVEGENVIDDKVNAA